MKGDEHEIRVGQLNMNGQRIVPVQLKDYCEGKDLEVLLLQEVIVEGGKLYGFEEEERVIFAEGRKKAKAAIVVRNSEVEVVAMRGLMDRYIAVATIRKKGGAPITFVSAYFKYDVGINFFTDRLGDIVDRIKGEVVIGVDTNAHSDMWFSGTGTNTGRARGTRLVEWIEDRDIRMHNRGGHPYTYSRPGMGESNIDVTLTRESGKGVTIEGWRVTEGVTDSDHNLIDFRVKLVGETWVKGTDKIRYDIKGADWDKFKGALVREHLGGEIDRIGMDVEGEAKTLVGEISRAMEISMKRRRRGARRRPPWWTNEIEGLRKEILAYRRRHDWRGEDRVEYRRRRNEYVKSVRNSKRRTWRKFASTINEEVWGPVYRWARKGPLGSGIPTAVYDCRGVLTETAQETAECLLNTLIPTDGDPPPLGEPIVAREGYRLEEEEVRRAVWRIGPNKAPGLDGITGGVLRKSWEVIGGRMTRILERCMRESTFPDCWKRADVVVIKKGTDKDPSLPGSYRPVSLLPVISKVLERLVVVSIERETEGRMCGDQHGFTAGKSTGSAIKECLSWVEDRKEKLVVGVFMDISGAFNNLSWEALMEDMREVGVSDATVSMIRSYIRGRTAELTVENSTASVTLTKGCPQGSQLGPTLWKIAMNAVLKEERHGWVKMVAYADDLVVMVAGTNIEVIRGRIRIYMGRIMEWARERGLRFSVAKTQVMSLKGGLKPGFWVYVGDDRVVASSPVRYLGVLVDYKRNFWEQVKAVAGKAGDLYSRLRGASSAEWGVGQRAAEIIYKSVFLPKIDYASEIWIKGVRTAKARKVLGSAQRRPLLSITKAYRTASTDALQVVAGRPPLDLEIEMGVLKKQLSKGEITKGDYRTGVEGALDSWQARWDGSDKGRWTHRILPDVKKRLEMGMELDHYTTQFLTGHGDFNAKLASMGLVGNGRCRCLEEGETVDHVLFRCRMLTDERNRLRTVVGREGETWPCEMDRFVETRVKYTALKVFAKEAIGKKRDYTHRNGLMRMGI